MAKRKKYRSPLAGLGPLVLALLFLYSAVLIMDQVQTAKKGFGPGDFYWDGDRMACISADAVTGIDVSYYQEEIDWPQVKASGIEFVFVRLGYRSSDDGSLCVDKTAHRNLAQAKEAGLLVGAYFFSQAVTPVEASQEAEFALEVVADYELDLPLAYDWEIVNETARTQGMTKEKLMACVEVFCTKVEAAGYDSLVYFNRDISQQLLNLDRLDREIWFAMYDSSYPDLPRKPRYWQYTNEGKVPGIQGNVDLNLGFFYP